jgi:hypothetical protein
MASPLAAAGAYANIAKLTADPSAALAGATGGGTHGRARRGQRSRQEIG